MGRGFFALDGPFNRIGTFIFDMMYLNILWIIFSLPIFTIGASTTALFYVTGKKVRNEDGYIFNDFWKSFKLNFKQATIIWLLILSAIIISVLNLMSIDISQGVGRYIGIFQFVVILQITIISIYIFPLLSRLYLNVLSAFKAAFAIGNKHLLTTIICIILFEILFFGTYIFPPILFFAVSLYAYFISFFIGKVLVNYLPKQEANKEEEKEPEEYAKEE